MRDAIRFIPIAVGLLLLSGCRRTEAECPAEAPSSCTAKFDGESLDAVSHAHRAEGDTFIEILDVVADGGALYACTGTQGLTVWDASRDDRATLLDADVAPGSVSHGSFPRCQHIGLDAKNEQLVITNRGDEIQSTPWLWLYDVSRPSSPESQAGWFGNRSIEGAVLDDERVWAATHQQGIAVFERNGGALDIVGEYFDGDSDAWQPVKVGETLIVAEGATGLRTYDISEDEPVLLASLDLGGSSRDLEVIDGRAFVTTSGAVAIVDVSDPAMPALLGEVPTTGTALGLAMPDESTVAVAEWDRVRGYDVSDPATAHQIFSERIPTPDVFSRVLAVAADPQRERIYAGEWTGMHVLDYSPEPRGPDLQAQPSTIQFGTVGKNKTRDRVVILENRGNEPLTVYSIASGTEKIEADADCLQIEPGEKAAAEVQFTAENRHETWATLKVCSNDPDEPEYPLQASANIDGRDVGDELESFALFDLDGERWTNDDLEGKVVLLAYFATF